MFFITGSSWRLIHPAVCPELGQSLITPPHTLTERSHTVTHNNLTSRGRNVQISSLLKHHQQVEESLTFLLCSARFPVNSLLSTTAIKGESQQKKVFLSPGNSHWDVGCLENQWRGLAKLSGFASFTNRFQTAQTSDLTSCSIVSLRCQRSDEEELKDFEDCWDRASLAGLNFILYNCRSSLGLKWIILELKRLIN